MKTLWKILSFLSLGLYLNAYAVDANQDIVQMYPDEMPKTKLIFNLRNKKQKEWDLCVTTSDYMINIAEYSRDFFKNLGFIPITFVYKNSIEKNCLLYGRKIQNEQYQFLFLQTELSFEQTPTLLKKVKIGINKSFYQKNKWQFSSVQESPNFAKEEAFELSWKFFDLILHKSREFFTKAENSIFLEKKLYELINNKPLDQVVQRALLKVNQNEIYSVYCVYDNDKELETNSKLLQEWMLA